MAPGWIGLWPRRMRGILIKTVKNVELEPAGSHPAVRSPGALPGAQVPSGETRPRAEAALPHREEWREGASGTRPQRSHRGLAALTGAET